jgi:N-acetyl-gamma-glutamyl-phosphate reductase
VTAARVAILGGTGYGGMELLRLLAGHPRAEVTAVTSRSETGPVGETHPHLRGFSRLSFTKESPELLDDLAAGSDLLFLARPHGVAARETARFLARAPRLKVVDLSGDHRLKDPGEYPEHYGFEHPWPAALADAVYGLPECGQREAIRTARLVANPGCHATGAILAIWPLARAGLVRGRVAVASVTGSSGSGADPKKGTHHPERFSNFRAYKPLSHQHLPEIRQALGGKVVVDFVPHSGPFSRGIHATAFVPVGDAAEAAVRSAFESAYGRERFVRILTEPPEIRAVAGSNMADLSVAFSPGLACVTCALDNLGKGMAGSAVQNMNLLLGFDEGLGVGLPGPGL